MFIFFYCLAPNGKLCDERIYEEVFVRRDKCLFGKQHTKCTKMQAYSIGNVKCRYILFFSFRYSLPTIHNHPEFKLPKFRNIKVKLHPVLDIKSQITGNS